jgi:hypothetical protein
MISQGQPNLLLVLLVWPCLCLHANAASYEFTITGEVTSSYYWIDVAAGDPFTIRYIADSADLDPSPSFGSYAATEAVVTFPTRSYTSQGAFEPRAFVHLKRSDGTDQAGYGHPGLNYGFGFGVVFPVGTLDTDALPVSVDVFGATSTTFVIYHLGILVEGDVNSYTSVLIPEPNALGTVLALSQWMRPARSRTRKCRSNVALSPGRIPS